VLDFSSISSVKWNYAHTKMTGAAGFFFPAFAKNPAAPDAVEQGAGDDDG
jgi:hypothetical protein